MVSAHQSEKKYALRKMCDSNPGHRNKARVKINRGDETKSARKLVSGKAGHYMACQKTKKGTELYEKKFPKGGSSRKGKKKSDP